MKRRTQFLLGVGGLALIGAVALVFGRGPPKVAVVTVSPQTVDRVLSVVGRARPVDLVDVMSTNPGQVIRLLHDDGDQVAAGDALAVVRSDAEQAQAAADQARVDVARTDLGQARLNYGRIRPLAGTGVVSQASIDQAQAAVETDEANLAAAVATARASAARSAEYTVRAPMAGLVLSRAIDNGQVVSPSTTLFELGSPLSVQIRADVDEAYADVLRPGMMARAAVFGSEATFDARVIEVSPEIDPSTGGRLVKLVPLDGPPLAPGRSVDVTIVVGRQANTIVVPRQAVVDAAAAAKVYVVDAGGVVRARAVRIARWPSLNAIVESGLESGDRVVADPTRTHPLAHVRPIAAPNPAA